MPDLILLNAQCIFCVMTTEHLVIDALVCVLSILCYLLPQMDN